MYTTMSNKPGKIETMGEAQSLTFKEYIEYRRAKMLSLVEEVRMLRQKIE